ncbi:hypothetical protein V9L05_01020 [Bernardetia sp. Wsw4-3y2]|uniref:hypothetical protein n=1 Tax=Bernardetia sp. Wsw4-3y2 TaxID=3127471 RepID=UPI0030CF79A6
MDIRKLDDFTFLKHKNTIAMRFFNILIDSNLDFNQDKLYSKAIKFSQNSNNQKVRNQK